MILDRKRADQMEKDITVLRIFIETYCNGRHKSARGTLCNACSELVAYAEQRLRNCPISPKPYCQDCRVHCYRAEERGRIREVMAYSGRRLLLRGRVDLLWHHFFSHSRSRFARK